MDLSDPNVVFYFFIFAITTLIVLGLYGSGITSIIFIGTLVYLFWVFSEGKITSQQLLNMSFIPGGVAILPIILLFIFVVIPSMILAWKMQKELIKLEKENMISHDVMMKQRRKLMRNPLATSIEMFRGGLLFSN